MKTLRGLSIIAGIAALGGCELGTGPGPSSPTVETDSVAYAMRATEAHWEARIAYSFTNATERPIFS